MTLAEDPRITRLQIEKLLAWLDPIQVLTPDNSVILAESYRDCRPHLVSRSGSSPVTR
jgi:hypothetical protein